MLATTLRHDARVLRLWLAGLDEPLGATGEHPFYSEDRRGWVPAGALRLGERVQTRHGPAAVERIAVRPGRHRVRNLEIAGTHEYLVTERGVRTHNACLAMKIRGGLKELATRIGRFFYDPRSFDVIRREYWRRFGPAHGRSLHHWLFPQGWTRIPEGIRNAGFNLLELPGLIRVFHPKLNLNTWMGFAPRWGGGRAVLARLIENGIRFAVPGSFVGAWYGGRYVGERLRGTR